MKAPAASLFFFPSQMRVFFFLFVLFCQARQERSARSWAQCVFFNVARHRSGPKASGRGLRTGIFHPAVQALSTVGGQFLLTLSAVLGLRFGNYLSSEQALGSFRELHSREAYLAESTCDVELKRWDSTLERLKKRNSTREGLMKRNPLSLLQRVLRSKLNLFFA